MSTQSQNNFSASHNNAFDTYKKFSDEYVTRLGIFDKEITKFEAKCIEQARTAIDEYSTFVKESMAYANQVAADWRRMALEYTRYTTDLVSPRA